MNSFTEKELEVAEVLRTMPALHRRPWPRRLIYLSPSQSHWVTKRKRSTIAKPSNASAPPQPPSSPKLTVAGAGLILESVKREGTPRVSPWSPLSLSFQRQGKAVTRNEECIGEQNRTITSPKSPSGSENNPLQITEQERMTARASSECPIAENTSSKEVEMIEKNTKKKKHKKKKTIEQCQQRQGLPTCRDYGSVSTLAVVPTHPTTAHAQPEFSGQLPQIQPIGVVAIPVFSLDGEKQAPTVDQFHHPPQPQQLQSQRPGVEPIRLWNLADTGGWTRIPDLNASVDENGEVVQDDSSQGHQEQVAAMVVDPTRTATAKARKKRMAIYRTRRKSVGDGGSARTGVTVGITAA